MKTLASADTADGRRAVVEAVEGEDQDDDLADDDDAAAAAAAAGPDPAHLGSSRMVSMVTSEARGRRRWEGTKGTNGKDGDEIEDDEESRR